MDISALTSHPLATVFSELTLPCSAVLPIHVGGVVRSLDSVGVLVRRTVLRARSTGLYHQVGDREPVVVLRVIGVVADRTSATTHLKFGQALRRITSQVGGLLGAEADLHVVVLPPTIPTGMHCSN